MVTALTGKATDLAISGLTKVFGVSTAVDGVTLRIHTGEMVALLGPSGCGKTTILRMIAGLVEPTLGEVLIGGYRVTHIPVHRRNIGMLFQNYALFPHLSVAENVAFGLQMRGLAKAEIRPKVQVALSLVQLGDYAERLPSALSGGRRCRPRSSRGRPRPERQPSPSPSTSADSPLPSASMAEPGSETSYRSWA